MTVYRVQRRISFLTMIVGTWMTTQLVFSDGLTPKGNGLAAKYPGDKDIAKDWNVIVFTDFESDNWLKQWSGEKRQTVSVVATNKAQKFEPLQKRALCFKVAKGDHYGGSIQYKFKKRHGREPEEIWPRLLAADQSHFCRRE